MANKRMLVCIDGSDIAEASFTYAIEQLYKPGDKILLLKVLETDYSFQALTSNWEKVCEQVKEDREAIYNMYSKYTAKLREQNIEGEGIKPSNTGKPGEVICAEAKANGATHIVMGTRGLGKIQRTFLGSVSNYVLNHADIPITIVPRQK